MSDSNINTIEDNLGILSSLQKDIEKRDRLLDEAAGFIRFIADCHDKLGQAKEWLKQYEEMRLK